MLTHPGAYQLPAAARAQVVRGGIFSGSFSRLEHLPRRAVRALGLWWGRVSGLWAEEALHYLLGFSSGFTN